MSNYPYQDATQAVNQIGNVIPQVMLGIARQRYQRDMLRQQMQLRHQQLMGQQALNRMREKELDSQIGLQTAQTGLANQRTTNLGQQQDFQNRAATAAQVLPLYHPSATPQIQARTGEILAGLLQSNPANFPRNMAQMMEMQNPRSRLMMATGARPIQSISSQGGTVDPMTGGIMEMAPQKLTPNQSLVPGAGGAPIVTAPSAPPTARTLDAASILRSLGNIRGQGVDSFGEATDPNDPTFRGANEAIQSLIPFLMQQATNQPSASVAPPNMDMAPSTQMITGQGGVPTLGESAGRSRPSTPAPPPPQRVVGQTYNTPKGPLKWTGTGWVQP